MSDTIKPEATGPTPPELEMAASCPACEGDVSVRFTGRRATGFCRKCGYVTRSIVHHHDGHVVFEQLVRAAA